MNGNGIQPTVELATTNGTGYPYPVYPMMGGYGNSGFGGYGGDWIWIILLFALFGWGNNGNGGVFNGGFNNDYAWLSNGQKEIMQNTNAGFNALQLSNDIQDVTNGLNSLSSQLCNSTYTLNDSIKDSFYNLNTSFLNCLIRKKYNTVGSLTG